MATTYRKLARKDVAAAHKLSLEVGWPHRVEDWQLVQSLGTGHVAVDAGAVVGTILTWKHDARNASLGMVVVAPSMQGRGIGKKLMRLALRDTTGRAVMLTATPAGQPLYERMGFRAIDVVEQHQGTAPLVPMLAPARGERLRPVGAGDVPRLAALATSAAGLSRSRVIARLLEVGDGIVLARGAEPIGFAIFRRFGRGFAIGPVVAPDAERARALVSHWVAMHPGKFLRIDVQASSGLGGWLDGIGLKKVDTGIAMVKGAAPAGDELTRTYALVNQALG